MTPDSWFEAAFADHAAVAAATQAALAPAFARMVGLCEAALAGGGKLLLFGNGGSAADAQHVATELMVRFEADRRPLPAIALTTDTSLLTACANDLGYTSVFARQIEGLARPGDVAIGLSTSGRSANVLRGLEAARRAGARAIGFCGADPGPMAPLCDAVIAVPSRRTARVQEMHILIAHALCAALEAGAGAAGPA
jgi:D-sedoheptulose 7-phosphate isomerase